MKVELEPKKTERVSPTQILQQTAFWGRLKKEQGRRARAFDIVLGSGSAPSPNSVRNSSETRGQDMLVVMRRISADAQMAYVPFGPELLPDEERPGYWLEQLSESLRHQLPENCLMIRYDLPWESPWANDKTRYTEDDVWLGNPNPRVQEMRMNFDTRNWGLRKAPTDLLPPDTVLVDVRCDRDRILKRMKPKTRYNIRLSGRKGVRVREGGINDLPAWYALYCQTADRHNMALNEMDYFESALRVRARHSDSPAKVHLLMAETAGVPVAGILLAISGQRATYLYGASSTHDRNLMAPYALQWEAIRLARSAGCVDYDLFGISPSPDPRHPMYGLYRFKTGFGGQMLHRQGCWDYPLDETRYEIYRATEMTAPGLVTR